MANKKLHLTIVSQEKELLSTEVDSVTAPTTEGEITVLPDHIPLFSKLETGELVYRTDSTNASVVISRGFIDVSPANEVKVMVDVALHEREISIEKAEAAVRAAQATMAEPTLSQRELILAEGSLRLALMEVKVAQRTKSTNRI